MMQDFLGCTHDDALVYERRNSHLKAHPIPQELLAEAFEMIDTQDQAFLVKEVTFDRVVGMKTCVPTTYRDEILYVRRKGRKEHSRFVKNRLPEPSNSMVVILKKISDVAYVLITAYVGSKGPGEPWDYGCFGNEPNPELAYHASQAFWSHHALVYDSLIIEQGTERDQVWWM